MPAATASGSTPTASGAASSGSGSAASGSPQQTQNAAAGMVVEYGAIAMGIAAVFGL